MKKAIKTIFLILGILNFAFITYLSYFVEPYNTTNPQYIKIILTVIASILYILVNLILIYPKIIKKEELSKDLKITMYFGIIIIPLIMLYN